MNGTKLEPAVALAELQEKKPDRVTIVLLSGDMDRAMAAFIIATGAAAMGMKVTMYLPLGTERDQTKRRVQLSERLAPAHVRHAEQRRSGCLASVTIPFRRRRHFNDETRHARSSHARDSWN